MCLLEQMHHTTPTRRISQWAILALLALIALPLIPCAPMLMHWKRL